ncbi:thiol reductase thioredoxin [Candidatus Bathyarchaeota archaeon]|nr:thiol reductase thioredoxin [Candidatus Bathyarchaeota archaeon]
MIDIKNVFEVKASNWKQEVLQSEMLRVVDFWHNRCPWCIMLNPIINETAEEYEGRIKFVKLNVLEDSSNQEIAINHGIMSTPVLMFFCKGRPPGQAVGFMRKEQLQKILDDVFDRHTDCIKQSTELKT